MAKPTTAKTQKAVVAGSETVAETPATENTGGNAANETPATENTDNAETDGGQVTLSGDNGGKGEDTAGLPFTVKDGLVDVVLKEFAGRSLYGTTGEIIHFDENGCAKVVFEEALYFQKMPGIEYK